MRAFSLIFCGRPCFSLTPPLRFYHLENGQASTELASEFAKEHFSNRFSDLVFEAPMFPCPNGQDFENFFELMNSEALGSLHLTNSFKSQLSDPRKGISSGKKNQNVPGHKHLEK